MEGAAHAIVSNVGQLVGEEFRQLRGVGGEVARLRDELATMNALLRMQSEAEEGAVDHFVREWMKQLREVGYDAQDCVDLYLFRVRTRSGDRLIGWCKRHLKTLLCRHRLAGDIRALRAHAAAVNEQHARYGVSLEALRHPPSSLSAVRASAHVLRLAVADGPNKLVGITEQAIFLADKVIAPSDTTDLKVFSVVGFGGLGKTTLVMEVCRHLESHFQRRAQVSVSQVLDLKALLRSVLHQILEVHAADSANNPIQPPADIDGMDTENLHQNIKTILKEKSSASAPQTRLQTLLRSLDSDGSGRISEKDLKRLNLLDEYTLFDEDGETKRVLICQSRRTFATSMLQRIICLHREVHSRSA